MIDHELEGFLTEWDSAWSKVASGAPVSVRRAMLEQLSKESRRPLPPGIESTVVTVQNGGRSVRVRIFRPRSGPATPCLIYMHGGGWVQGSPETHDEITASIAAKNRQTVVSVDYALAPENPFPAAVEDCKAVVQWTFANAAALNIKENMISIGGDSAGANLAASMALVFRGSSHLLAGQLLFYPVVDFTLSRPSFIENADGPVLTTAGFIEMVGMYLPTAADRTNPLAAPLQAPDLSRLPPAFIAIAECDPLRDDGRVFAERLAHAGVAVQLHSGLGLVHGYLRALSYSRSVRAAFEDACEWLRELPAQPVGARSISDDTMSQKGSATFPAKWEI
jgi:acetyl esterase